MKPHKLFRASYSPFPFIICGLAALFYVYDYFLQVAPSVMTNQLMQEFSIGAGSLGLLSACFYYSYTLMQIPAGLLIDRYGARKLLSLAVFVAALGVILFGLTHHFSLIGVARFLIGLGSSFAFISTLYLVSRWFAHQYFAFIAGLVQLGGSLGSIIGLAPLSIIINHFGWRQTMVVTGMITIALSFIYWLVIRDSKTEISTPSNVSFAQGELKRLKIILKIRQVWWIGTCGFLCWIPTISVGALWGVPYLMKVYGWNNTTAGHACSWLWIGLGIGSPIIGWLSDKIKSRTRPLILCFSLAIMGSLIFIAAPYLNHRIVAVGLLLLGVSASVQSLSFGIIKDTVPSDVFATASGLNNMAAILGGGLSQPLIGFLLYWQWDGMKIAGVPFYSVHNYQIAFIILPFVGILGLLVSLLKIKETHCRKSYS